MSNKRTLNQLWKIAHDSYSPEANIGKGLCYYLDDLHDYGKITYDELNLLTTSLKVNRPTFFKNIRFYFSFYYRSGASYWWTATLEGNLIRKQFLKYLSEKSYN